MKKCKEVIISFKNGKKKHFKDCELKHNDIVIRVDSENVVYIYSMLSVEKFYYEPIEQTTPDPDGKKGLKMMAFEYNEICRMVNWINEKQIDPSDIVSIMKQDRFFYVFYKGDVEKE